MSEGYIKFNLEWVKGDAPLTSEIVELNGCRNELWQLGLIGVLPDGIGYGNVSARIKGTNQFLISGTQTGGIAELNENHYTKVVSFDADQNQVTCEGPIKASSESMSHAMLYEADPEINAVIHIHSLKLWQKLIDKDFPVTGSDIAYGTPEMAKEIVKVKKMWNQDVIVMGGHEEGILVYSRSVQEALGSLLNLYNKLT